jgi:hypothetical protein
MSGPERSSTDSTVSKCRGLYCLLALLAGVLARQPAALAQPCTLAGLHWMAGTWLNSQDTSGAQERWVVAPGEVLMGSAWEFPKGHAGYAEVMAIRQDGDGISMFLRHFDAGLARAWEEPTAPMVFAASDCGASTATFSGQGAHAGERMTYTRSSDALLIVADFLHQGKPHHEEWHMRLTKE